jgi:hypothetical protein
MSRKSMVTDHAVLRYLERVKGFDIAAVRREMLTPGVVAALKAKATAVIIDGVRFQVTDGTIITVFPDDPRKLNKYRHHRKEAMHEA